MTTAEQTKIAIAIISLQLQRIALSKADVISITDEAMNIIKALNTAGFLILLAEEEGTIQ